MQDKPTSAVPTTTATPWDANKIQIRKAVEEVFNVKVDGVNTINVKGKLRRRGATKGYTRSWKKAVVTLKPDQHIEFFEGASI